MKRSFLRGRTLALGVVVISLLGLFVLVSLRSGPLAPVSVTIMTVSEQAIAPALFGIGTIEARYAYRIGPTSPGRLERLDVHVGDRVKAGQILGEMEPVDLDQRLQALGAVLNHAEAAFRETMARQSLARIQAERYRELLAVGSTSEELVTTREHELLIADAVLSGAREELSRARFEQEALLAQRNNLRLIAPVDGLVTMRNAEPGTTLVAGQAVVEMIDPQSLWVNTHFDQGNAAGLAAGLDAGIVLRSRSGSAFRGRVLRVEPIADPVTEELLAKLVFDSLPETLPPVGESAEVTIALPELPSTPVIPNAAIHREAGALGVWKIIGTQAHFVPVVVGVTDLEGHVQVLQGVTAGEQVVVYSEKQLGARSRIRLVSHIPGTQR